MVERNTGNYAIAVGASSVSPHVSYPTASGPRKTLRTGVLTMATDGDEETAGALRLGRGICISG